MQADGCFRLEEEIKAKQEEVAHIYQEVKVKEEENVALQSEMVTAREKHEEATAALMAATTPAHQVVTKHITVF